jgi:hypothetical protein
VRRGGGSGHALDPLSVPLTFGGNESTVSREMRDEQSPFERPPISQGYPLDENEKEALREGLEHVRQSPAERESEPEGNHERAA